MALLHPAVEISRHKGRLMELGAARAGFTVAD